MRLRIRFSLNIFSFVLVLFTAFLFTSCSSSDEAELSTDNPETAFSIAKSKYEKGDYLDAIEDLSLIKLRFSGSKIIDQAIYYLGMSYVRRDEFILAAYEFDYLLKNYPTSPIAEDALYQLAMSYYSLSPDYTLDQTYTKLAINEFQNYIDFFPNGKNVSTANTRISELRNKLAYKNYMAAEQYVKMDNYSASIVYYDYVLNDYFDTEYADDALFGKIQMLIVKKRYEDARKEISRMEEKFPNSPYLSRALSLRNQIP